MNNLIDDCNIIKSFDINIRLGKVPHAHLFLSEDEDMLVNVSREVACRLFGAKDGANTNIRERVYKGIFPDVIEIGLEKAGNVKDIEQIINDSIIAPFEGDKKLFILYHFDEMNDSASNKLLKTLEEPPKNVYFILCAKNEFALLTTIKSRVEKMYLERFDSSKMLNALIREGVDEKVAEVCVGLSLGLWSNAHKMATDKKYVELIKVVQKTFLELDGSVKLAEFCDLYGQNKQNFDEILDIMACFARDLLMIKIGAEDLIDQKSNLSLYHKILNEYSCKSLTKLLEKIIDLKEKIFYNVNVVELIDELLFYFVEVKIKCRE